MTATALNLTPRSPASLVLGRKLDSIPFSAYHVLIIAVLGLVGFIEGYDLAMTGSLLVLAKQPLNLTPENIRFLAVASTGMICVGGFIASAISDHCSRKTIMQIGVVATTFFTLLVPLVQTADQLIIVRLLTGVGARVCRLGRVPDRRRADAGPAPPHLWRDLRDGVRQLVYGAAVHRAAGGDQSARLPAMALPGGLALFVVPVLIFLLLPESPRWHLRRGDAEAAVDAVNKIIRRSGNRVPPLTVATLGFSGEVAKEALPPYRALFARGQLRWTVVGILSGVCAGTAFFLISVLLPKALVDQGAAVSLSFGVTSIAYAASFGGKCFTGFLMEIIGRRWTITYALAGSLPGLAMMLMAHKAGGYAFVMMTAGALITGFTVLSAFTATRVYLAEQFPTSLRGRGHVFGESAGRLFAGVLMPFMIEPYTASPTIFFGTIAVVVAIGAFIPPLFGKETVGQLESFTEAVPELA